MKRLLQRYKIFILAAFVLAEIGIYIAFLTIHIGSGNDPVMLKYSGILLCLAVTAVLAPVCGKDGLLLTAALLFTAISDLFIFVIDDYYEIGLCTFIAVQLIYFARIYLTCNKKPYISVAVRAVLIIGVIIALGVMNSLNALTALVGIYFPMLLCNAADSVLLIKKSKQFILFFAGLLLFIGCDICVGLNNFSSVGITLSAEVKKFVSVAMWAFYLPSQTLIVTSIHSAVQKEEVYEK